MSWSLFLTFLSLLSLSCFWCRFSIRRRGHKAGFHLCLEGRTRGAKRKVAEIFRTWKSFLCLQDEDKCPQKITWDPCTDSSSLEGFSQQSEVVCFPFTFSQWSMTLSVCRKWKWKSLSRVSLQPLGLYSPWHSPGQNTGVGSLSLLQGIFPTQGLNSGLPHCRLILYSWASREAPAYVEIFPNKTTALHLLMTSL